ncbi:MAG: hypothetical protein ACYTEZ_08375 [Planctomycetota bacterium]
MGALAEPAPSPAPPEHAAEAEPAGGPTEGDTLAAPPVAPAEVVAEAPDEITSFYESFEPGGLDRQADAALLFAYYLQRREGLRSLQLSDLIRCCIRAGVDTRNFNRTLGTLTRRGFLETVRHGHAYRLSGQGVAAVENRM